MRTEEALNGVYPNLDTLSITHHTTKITTKPRDHMFEASLNDR